MAKFVPGMHTEVKSSDSFLDVQASRSTPLRPGRHVFQLVVLDTAGNSSAPASVSIPVQDPDKPNAVIDFVRDDGVRVYDSTLVVPYARPFRLTGERSTDANGSVTSWSWTLLAR
jgi:hypothetical protein